MLLHRPPKCSMINAYRLIDAKPGQCQVIFSRASAHSSRSCLVSSCDLQADQRGANYSNQWFLDVWPCHGGKFSLRFLCGRVRSPLVGNLGTVYLQKVLFLSLPVLYQLWCSDTSLARNSVNSHNLIRLSYLADLYNADFSYHLPIFIMPESSRDFQGHI